VADIVALYTGKSADADLLHRASQLPDLPESWRQFFGKRFGNPSTGEP
jgi:hypothetical protein